MLLLLQGTGTASPSTPPSGPGTMTVHTTQRVRGASAQGAATEKAQAVKTNKAQS